MLEMKESAREGSYIRLFCRYLSVCYSQPWRNMNVLDVPLMIQDGIRTPVVAKTFLMETSK